jgi:SAM-dependent methyltransferase
LSGDPNKTDRMATIRGDYDRIGAEYADHLGKELEAKPLDRELLLRFARAVTGRGKICDLGCGPGQVARFLHEAGAEVFGLDLSAQMVAQARLLNPDIRFEQGDMLALDLPDGGLAGIAAFYAIVNFPGNWLPAIFREMVRVLTPGGLLLLAFHIGDEVLRPGALWGKPIRMEFFYHQPIKICELLCDAGFAIEETVERGPYAPEVEHQSQRAYIFARKLETAAG